MSSTQSSSGARLVPFHDQGDVQQARQCVSQSVGVAGRPGEVEVVVGVAEYVPQQRRNLLRISSARKCARGFQVRGVERRQLRVG